MESIKIRWDQMESYTSVPIEYRFIDSAEVVPGQEAWGRKAVSSQDWYFKIHFPGNPLMPGVLLMEAIQQTGLLIVTAMPDTEEKVMLFHGCKNMRMFNSVRPGDMLRTHVVMDSFRLGVANFHGEVEIDRFSEEKPLRACTMEFVMCLKSQMLSIPREKNVQTKNGGEKLGMIGRIWIYIWPIRQNIVL